MEIMLILISSKKWGSRTITCSLYPWCLCSFLIYCIRRISCFCVVPFFSFSDWKSVHCVVKKSGSWFPLKHCQRNKSNKINNENKTEWDWKILNLIRTIMLTLFVAFEHMLVKFIIKQLGRGFQRLPNKMSNLNLNSLAFLFAACQLLWLEAVLLCAGRCEKIGSWQLYSRFLLRL